MMNTLACFQGYRLRSAREARGLQSCALADCVGVSKASMSQYENGAAIPTHQTACRIAATLDLPLPYFYTVGNGDHLDGISWRSQASATKLARLRAERRLEWLVSVVDVLGTHFTLPRSNFPTFVSVADPRELTDESVEEAAAKTRRFWNLGDGPISNLTLLLENQGAIVVRRTFGSEALDAFSLPHPRQQRSYVVLGDEKKSAARSIFDAAHELGHLVMHHGVPKNVRQQTDVHKIMEAQAMRFAGAFLMPAETFASDLYSASLDSFLTLKSKWRVAVQAMVKRAAHLHLISEETERAMWIRIIRRGWKTCEPLDDVMPVEEPRLIRRCFDLLVEHDIDIDSLVDQVMLRRSDIEDVCGLPAGYLQGRVDPPLPLRLAGEASLFEQDAG